MDTRCIHAAVSGLNASDNPAPGVGVAKSLRAVHDYDWKIAGLAYDAMEPGIYLDEVFDHSYMVPYPSAGHEALLDRLYYIHDQFKLDIILPTLDAEIPFYMQSETELRDHGIETFLPTREQYRLRAKDKLAELAEKTGLELPRQIIVSSYDELSKAAAELGYPVMVKGSIYKAYRAYSLDEAMNNFAKIIAQWGYPVIVQKVITGEEMNVIGAGDGDGGVLGLVAIKKMSVTELGKIWTGVTISHPGMIRAAREFVANTKWRGGFELECMVDGDKVWLIEINPRFPAWVYFATGVGVNLPAQLVKKALGLPLEKRQDYETGKLYIRYTGERIVDMTVFQNMVTAGES
jgi:carbamoyl-phosphate synthase large subunit